jgi:hypothetical protein
MKAVVALGLLAGACCAQTSTLRVVSEFTRIDPFGEIVPQDRGKADPREFLSPGIPRGAYSSLRIVVTFDKPATYVLDIGQNPENAVRPTLYKEKFEKHGDQWIPDGLEQVNIPYEGSFPSGNIPGQTTVTFWLDMWVERNAPVDRIKVEPQLWVSTVSDWFTYPMEARVLATVIPAAGPSVAAALPPVADRSDAAVMGPLRARFCGVKEQPGPATPGARELIRRNVLMHLAVKDPQWEAKLLSASGAGTVAAWCSSKAGPVFGPEWYLRLRDSVVQARQDSQK